MNDLTPEKAQMSEADAARIIEAGKKLRVEQAAASIQRVLQDNLCELLATPQITADGRIVAIVQILAR